MNNKEKQIREEFKKLVVLGCHPGKSYEEALEVEVNLNDYRCSFDITIGRVMQALQEIDFFEMYTGKLYKNTVAIRRTKGEEKSSFICEWKLTKKNGSECTDDDQDIETITKLLNLLKNA